MCWVLRPAAVTPGQGPALAGVGSAERPPQPLGEGQGVRRPLSVLTQVQGRQKLLLAT